MDKHFQYLIVGGGMAGQAAVGGIREVDAAAQIGIVSEDQDPPYKRPYLSKALWKGKPFDRVWLPLPEDGVAIRLNRTVERIDVQNRRVHTSDGSMIGYGKLLLATGVSARHIAPDSDRIFAFRSLQHFRRLFELAKTGQRVAVIGSGFIGSELAAALQMTGKDVEMIYPSRAIGDKLYPSELAHYITERYRSERINLHPFRRVASVTERSDGVVIELAGLDGSPAEKLEVDAVVTGIGSDPNDGIASAAGLQTDNGIVVNRTLQASHEDVFAAGDVARFYQPSLRKLIRIEHEDNALTMGRAAGRSMAGTEESYDHLPFFYSDLFDMGYEAVGELDARHRTVVDWVEPLREGVVYYMDGNDVRGILLWNHWDKVAAAREMIGAELPEKGEGSRGALLTS